MVNYQNNERVKYDDGFDTLEHVCNPTRDLFCRQAIYYKSEMAFYPQYPYDYLFDSGSDSGLSFVDVRIRCTLSQISQVNVV